MEALLPVIEGAAGNSLFELLKSKKDRFDFFKIFKSAGLDVAEYEHDGTEEGELRRVIFSKENMQTLAEFMIKKDPFHFDMTLEKCLDELLIRDGLTAENRDNCKQHFLQIVYSAMDSRFPYLRACSRLSGMYETVIKLSDKVDCYDKAKVVEPQASDNGIPEISYQLRSDRRESINIPAFNPAIESKWLISDPFRDKVFVGRKDELNDVAEVLNSWKEERESYLGWFIIPYSYSEKLRYNTERYSCWVKMDYLPLELELEFCGEYVWRLQTGKFACNDNILINIRAIWEKYTPDDIDVLEKWSVWFEIACFLLREYRDSGLFTEWQDVFAIVSKHKERYLNGTELLSVEEINCAFHRFDMNKVRRLLARCNLSANVYDLRLQKCGLEAECGNTEDALEHTVKLKNDLKKCFRTCVEEDEIRVYSLYAAVLLMESFLIQCNAFAKGEYEKNQQVINDILDEMEDYKEYFDWDHLLSIVRHDLLKWHVKKYDSEQPFDLSKESMVIISSGNRCLSSYYLYRVLDAINIPLKNNHVTLLGKYETQWLESLQEMLPHLSMFLMLRGSSKNTIKLCYDRNHLRNLDQDEIISQTRFVLSAFDFNLEELSERNTVGACFVLRENLPLMLERLASRGNDELQYEILLLLERVMEQPEQYLYQNCNKYLYGLMKQISEKNKAKALGILLKTRIVDPVSTNSRSKADIDLFSFYFRKKDIEHYKVFFHIDQDAIEYLLRDENDSGYVWRAKVRRLLLARDYNILTKEQEHRLTQKIWEKEHIDEKTGLPELQDLFLWNLCKLDYSDSGIPAPSIKNILLSNGLIVVFGNESGCCYTGGNIRYLDELIAVSTQMDKDFWTMKEVESIYEDGIQYWQILKIKIREDKHFFSFDEYECRAKKIFKMLAILYKSVTGSMDERMILKTREMIEEAKELKLNVSQLEILFVPDSMRKAFIERLKECLYSTDKNITVDALITAGYYIETWPDETTADELLEEMLQILRCRKLPGLGSALIMLHNLLYLNCCNFTLEKLSRIDKQLPEIEKMTAYENCRNSEEEVKKASEIRKSCMALAYQISLRSGTEAFPGVLCWKNVYAADEFNDVKNEMLI